MKKKYLGLLAFIMLVITIGCSSLNPPTNRDVKPPSKFKVATYNIRLPSKADVETGNGWDIRKQPLTELILNHDFDIVGVQEPFLNQINDLKRMLDDYDYVTAPYATQSLLGIYYKKALFQAIDDGMFWLSETPDIPSEGWDSDEKRIVHWVKFIHKESAREFYYFNTHFYWKRVTARKNSGPLAAQKIKEIAGNSPVIFVGDFNSGPTTSQVQKVKVDLHDAFDVTETARKGPANTGFPGGVFEGDPKSRIDYIFVSKDIKVLDFTVHDDKYSNDRYPSDHLPVSSNILIK